MKSNRWFIVLGIVVLAFGVLVGSALADPGDPIGEGNGEPGQGMSAQMDPETYGQMIQRMIGVHGAEFTSQMLQKRNEGGDCHGDGPGMMGGHSFGGMMNGIWRGARGVMNGVGGMMNGGSAMGGGMMGR